jgi:hypothetical protein
MVPKAALSIGNGNIYKQAAMFSSLLEEKSGKFHLRMVTALLFSGGGIMNLYPSASRVAREFFAVILIQVKT